LASVRCATPIAKVNVFLSAFASQRTDVPLCKRRTDFLYGSKADYLWAERDRLLANNGLGSENPKRVLLSLSQRYMMSRLYKIYARVRRINPNLARIMRFLFFRLKDVIKKYVLSRV
jgi:hypothetical protein